jgi:hypothetical protein
MLKKITFALSTAIALGGCAGPVTFASSDFTPDQVKDQLAGKMCQRKYESPCRISGRDAVCVTTTNVKFVRDGESLFARDMERRAPNGKVLFSDLKERIVTVPPKSGGRLSFNVENWNYYLRLAKQGDSIHLLGETSKGVEKYDVDFECPP